MTPARDPKQWFLFRLSVVKSGLAILGQPWLWHPDTQEALEALRRHSGGTSAGTQGAPSRHPGGTQEAPRGTQGTQEAPEASESENTNPSQLKCKSSIKMSILLGVFEGRCHQVL